MPHLVVDYAAPLVPRLDVMVLLQSLHQAALESTLFDEAAIKTRALAFEFHTVSGKPQDFVHVSAKILSGRSAEQKRQLSQLLFAVLESQVPEEASRTVEVVEMDRASYLKG